MKIISMNSIINQEFNSLSRLLITHKMKDTRNLKNALRINLYGHCLERIGDHTCNFSNYVVFLVKGKNIRHTNLGTPREEFYLEEDF